MTDYPWGSVVSNTGPLITLEKLPDGFAFIRKLFKKILIPQAVLDELAQGTNLKPEQYLAQYQIDDLLQIEAVQLNHAIPGIERLHHAEALAISLAHHMQRPLLIEEMFAKEVAQSLGLEAWGIAGQIIRAYRLGMIEREQASNKLYQLRYKSFRINDRIYRLLMQDLD